MIAHFVIANPGESRGKQSIFFTESLIKDGLLRVVDARNDGVRT